MIKYRTFVIKIIKNQCPTPACTLTVYDGRTMNLRSGELTMLIMMDEMLPVVPHKAVAEVSKIGNL
jgi:hypothetical protein